MNQRSIAVAFLGVTTLIIGIGAIYLGAQTSQEDAAPTDSSASTDQVCNISESGGALVVNNCAGLYEVAFFEIDYNETGTTFYPNCLVSQLNSGEPGYSQRYETLNNGTYDPFSPCKCVQIDIITSRTDPDAIVAATCRCSGGPECLLPVCGNGAVEAGEACDDGNNNDNDACRNDCTIPVCGDGKIDSGEECDDGNSVDGDGCETNCTTTLGDPGQLIVAPYCTSGNESRATVTWTPGPDQGSGDTIIQVASDNSFSVGYWERTVATSVTTVEVPIDFLSVSPETQSLSPLVEGNLYYVQVEDEASSTFYEVTSGQQVASFTAESCIADGCGDPCTSNDQCPNDHVCNNSTCVLELCIDNPTCTNNGCTLPLPETGLFDGESKNLIVGIFFVVLGLLFTQLNYGELQLYLTKQIEQVKYSKNKRKEKVSKKENRFKNHRYIEKVLKSKS